MNTMRQLQYDIAAALCIKGGKTEQEVIAWLKHRYDAESLEEGVVLYIKDRMVALIG